MLSRHIRQINMRDIERGDVPLLYTDGREERLAWRSYAAMHVWRRQYHIF